MKSPIKLDLKSEIFPLALLLVSAVASYFFYQNSPETVTTHWNFQGQPDGYSSRGFGSFFFPGLLAFIYLLMIILPYFDPKRESYKEFEKPYRIFRYAMLLILSCVYWATGFYNVGYDINIGIITAFLIGALMIVIGNYLGKMKLNWFVGIKTPWTLSSENVWSKTHRLGGILFMIFGLIIMIAPFLPEMIALGLFIGWAAILIVGTFAYSYWLYRKEKK